jgi:ankyrin repeat protein
MLGADADLFDAAMRGDAEAGQQALAAGACIEARNANGLNALLVVAAGGPGGAPLLEVLLAAGAEHDCEDEQGWSATVYAASGGVLPLLAPLLAAARAKPVSPRGASDGGGGGAWTPLARAAYRGHAAAVQLLLDDGASPFELALGRSPREWAVSAGHGAVAESLQCAERAAAAAAEAAAATAAMQPPASTAAASGAIEPSLSS